MDPIEKLIKLDRVPRTIECRACYYNHSARADHSTLCLRSRKNIVRVFFTAESGQASHTDSVRLNNHDAQHLLAEYQNAGQKARTILVVPLRFVTQKQKAELHRAQMREIQARYAMAS